MINKYFKFYLLLLCVIYMNQSYGQSGAKYEPPDGRIIHGLGQYVIVYYSDQENWQFVTEYQNAIGNEPVIYSVYAYLDPLSMVLDSTDFIDIVSNHGYPYVLLVGLALFDTSFFWGTVNIPVQTILNGGWDPQIIHVAQRIKAVNAPVYLRPGFEFESGIHSDPNMSANDFINIWMHIYNVFQQQNVTNVAWIWNAVNPTSFNYMDWYPGDSYVDWWGINYFTPGQLSSGDGFLSDAAAHGKPVMICESCPIQNGGTTNNSNWNNWFLPYFAKIKNTPHIKGFIYISDPWDRLGFFNDWPDSRININSTISQNYATELLDSVYINMLEYQNNPGIIIQDSSFQASVPDFTAEAGNQQVRLTWINPAEFAGVKIIRKSTSFPQTVHDGLEIFDGIDTTYVDTNVVNDTTYYYSAFAYDSIPNYSVPAFAYATPYCTIQAPVTNFNAEPGDELVNLRWSNPETFEGIKIIRKTKSFPLNISDGLEIYDGIDSLFVDMNVENDTTYFYAAFAYDSIPNISMPVYTSATPQSANRIEGKNLLPNQIYISRNYPNPFNSTTKFKIVAPPDSKINITIYNITGEQVANNLYNFSQKNNIFTWHTENQPSGIYIAKIKIYSKNVHKVLKYNSQVSKTLKLLLLK